MKINKSNYEAYFLDFVEGNLSANQQAELDMFLAENPDLKFELDSFEEVILPSEELVDGISKSKLKRNEETGLKELDYLLISELENTLSVEEKNALSQLNVENSKLEKERALYSKTKLNKSEVVLFPNKATLIKKPAKVIYFYRYVASIAAAVLALFLFNFNFKEDQYVPRKVEFEKIEKEIPLETLNINIEEEQKSIPDIEKKSKPSRIIYAAQEPRISPKEIEEEQNPNIEIQEESLATIPLIESQKENEEHALVPVVLEKSEEQMTEVTTEEEFVPFSQFAKNKLKEKLLNNRTLTETLAEELAEATNQKISFETVKNEDGKTEQFAINIGKFSFSRNK